MKNKPALLGLYWSARSDPFEACVEQLYASLRGLQSLGYERYYALGRSRRDALKRPFDVTLAAVRQKLARGRSYTDIPRAPMPELGWQLSLWSGGADLESYSLSVSCGADSEHVNNRFVLELPACGEHSIGTSSDRAIAAFDLLADIWKPEQGVLADGSIDWKDGLVVAEGAPLRIIRPRA